MGLFDKAKPRNQYYGGDEEALQNYRKDYDTGVDAADVNVQAGINQQYGAAREYANTSDITQLKLNQQSDAYANAAELANTRERLSNRDASVDRGAYLQAAQGMNRGASDINASAATMERAAMALPGTYQQTSNALLQQGIGQNARSAISAASGGGALGLRNALAGASAANANAVNNALITQANEQNQLIQMQQGIRNDANAARAQAAGLYGQAGQSALASQGQNLGQGQYYGQTAGQYMDRQQATQLSANDVALQAAQLAQSTGANIANTGLAQQGNYLQASQGLNTAQLEADAGTESDRNKQQYDKAKWAGKISNWI